MKTIITIVAAIIIGLLILGGIFIDNRTEETIQETEEKTCNVILNDISNQMVNEIINSILLQLENTGQLIINTNDGQIILVPLK